MYLGPDDRRPRMRNGLALRIAVIGGVALALFAVLFFRLWYLQVLTGEQYLAEANNNRTREFRVTAPRGNILDRNGNVLVDNRTSLALQVNPQKLPPLPARRQAELAQPRRARPHVPAPGARDDARTAEVGGGRPGHPAPRRRLRPRLLPAGKPGPLPGGPGAAGLRPPLPRRDAGRARAGQRRRGQRRTAQRGALPQAAAGRRGRPGRGRGHLRPLPARAARADPDPGQRARPADPRRAARLQAAGPRRQPQALDRLLGAGGGGTGARRPRPARRLRDDERPQRPDPRPGLLPDLRPDRSSPNR